MRRFPNRYRRGIALPRLLGLILLAIGLLVTIVGAYLVWNNVKTRLALAGAEQQAEAIAEDLGGQIESVRAALASPAFRAAAGANRPADRDALVRILRQQGVTNILNLVVAREAIEQVDLSTFPGGGFAALQMLLDARFNGSAPMQVHFAGTPDEYLAVAERLGDSETAPVVLATFPVSVLVNRIQLPDAISALQLLQTLDGRDFRIAQFGDREGEQSGEIPISGSLLSLTWHRATAIGPMTTIQLVGVLGVGLLTVGLSLLVLHRTRGVALEGKRLKPLWPPRGKRDDAEPPAATPPEPTPPDTQSTPSDTQSEPPQSEPRAPKAPSPAPAPEPGDAVARDVGAQSPAADAPEPDPKPTPEPEPGPEPEPEPEPELAETPPQPPIRNEEPALASATDREQTPSVKPETETAEVDSSRATVSDKPVTIPSASIFRAYDIRGVVGQTLSEEVAYAVGRAIGSEARGEGLSKIAVARDGRVSGAALLAALGDGLIDCGLDVIDVGAVPTPVLYYAAHQIGGGSGVMVTGSHNPPDYNGFKIVLGGETLAGERIQRLHRRLVDGDLEHGDGQRGEQSVTEDYIRRVSSDIQLEKPIKVVADCGNGIAGAVAPKLLAAIGADVIPLYAEVDGTFPNHHPDPGDPATLEDLKLCVRNFDADIGVAFDGDGDRLGVVAPGGEVIYPDRLMMLFARDVLSRNPGEPIIFDVKCSSLLPVEIEKAGGKPVMARTGHSFLKQQLKRDNAPLAGEMSGHFFFKERWFGFDDGLYSAARLLEILAADSRAVGQVLASAPKAVSTPELKVEMKEGEPHPFVQAFSEAARFDGARLTTIDGLRADFEDGFGLLRASNTTPILVLRFEGVNRTALTRIQDQFREQMLAINPALKLPF